MPGFVIGLAAQSALLCVLLILLLRPVLVRYALARPNARSSHRVPTPQGGGIAVFGAAIAVGAYAFLTQAPADAAANPLLHAVLAATLILAITGAVDDLRPLPAWPRLALQALAVGLVIVALEPGLRLLPDAIPLVAERALIAVALLWFVNLVNFMDGLDWISVAGLAPALAVLAGWGAQGGLALEPTLVAAVLLGGLLGFALFNKPVAKLFLGDVGSLPLGLVTGWLLIELAGTGHLAAALLLPLYHASDASWTLLRRLACGERVWEAHRSHAYQRATDHGFRVLDVVARVVALNLILAGLAVWTLLVPHPAVQIGALGAGLLLTIALLRHFTTPRRRGAA